MSGAVFLLSWLAVPLFAAPLARLWPGSDDSRAGRFAFVCGAGAVLLTLVMLLLTSIGVRWSVAGISIALGFLSLTGWLARRAPAPTQQRAALRTGAPNRRMIAALVAAAAGVILFSYAAATARTTSTDFLFFWGPKGQQFALARRIDVAFLGEPDHFVLHSDYPPLLPCLYAWGAMAARRFPWGAGLLSAPIFFALMVAAFWGSARRRLDDSSAALRCTFFAALLGLGWMASDVAGNAEPPLLFFETLALGILVFGERSPRADFAASIALAGCVLAKFEGVFFAVAAAGVFCALGPARGRLPSRMASALRLLSLPALALGGWIAFCARHGILYNYKPGTAGPVTFVNFSKVAAGLARSTSYGLGYLPWIAVFVAGLAIGVRREAVAPALVAVAIALVNVGYYLHGAADPTLWIGWSARRIFLTPLLCLAFAASASGRAAEATADSS